MRQLLIPRLPDDAERYEATGEDFHYLAHVLRVREGASVPAGDKDGGRYRLTLERREKERLVFSVRRETAEPEGRSGPDLTLFMCLPKPVKMDLIIRMAVEVGVSRIVPVASAHGAVGEKEIPRLEDRVERWRKIARAAFQQSGRRDPPAVGSIIPFSGIVPAAKLRLFADERGGLPLHEALGERTPERIDVLVGPEGGLADGERRALADKGFVPIHLGKNILRTETAAVVVCAAVLLVESERTSWKPTYIKKSATTS